MFYRKSIYLFVKNAWSFSKTQVNYATQSWKPSEEEIKKLEACWCSFLRIIVKSGFRKKSADGNDIFFSLVYTNQDLLRITKCHPIRDFINTQYLKYIAQVCRRPNTNLTKLSLFLIPRSRYYQNTWIKISKLLGVWPSNRLKGKHSLRSVSLDSFRWSSPLRSSDSKKLNASFFEDLNCTVLDNSKWNDSLSKFVFFWPKTTKKICTT